MTKARTHRRPALTSLSAFTGLGGLDLGLEKAGFRTLGCIENDAVARASVAANRPNWLLLDPPDILEVAARVDPADLALRVGQLSVLGGGPPCQPYSKAAEWAPGGRQGYADPRAGCLDGFLVLVEKFLPQCVLIENVPGFARGRTSALPMLEEGLKTINHAYGTAYRIEHRFLNAADYGVPQNRRRVIMVAFQSGQPFRWPEPTHTRRPVRAWDAIGGLNTNGARQATGRWAELLPSIPEGENYQWHTREGGGEPLFGYRRWYWSFLLKLAKNQPAWTLPAHPGPSTGPFHWDNRPLTIPEALRLQSFPANWAVHGTYRQQLRQVGNATPPLLSELLGRAVREQLTGRTVQLPVALSVPRKRRVPPPSPVGAVPGSYHDLIGEHDDHPGEGLGPAARAQ